MSLKPNILNNFSGMTLIEIMIAAGIASFLALGVSQTATYVVKSTNSASISQELNESLNMLNTYISSSPATCAGLFRNITNVGALTSTAVNSSISMAELVAPTGTGGAGGGGIIFKPNTKLNNDPRSNWQTVSVRFVKWQEFTNWTDTSVSPNTMNVSFTGALELVVKNLAVPKKSVGAPTVGRTVPVSFSMQKVLPSGAFKVVSCSVTQGNSVNTNYGWNGSASDPNCSTVAGPLCPANAFYVGNSGSNMVCCRVRF